MNKEEEHCYKEQTRVFFCLLLKNKAESREREEEGKHRITITIKISF